VVTISTEINGKTMTLETGNLAKQANGAVTVQCGDSLVLVTAVAKDELIKNAEFFPLTVDVEERMYAAGKIPGGFLKREGRPSETSILTARLIDRPIRPSFPDGFVTDVHVIATILSADQINPPDVLAMLGASAAMSISDIPFNGPLAAIRVGIVDDQVVFNPTYEELTRSLVDIIVAGTKDEIIMVEGEADEVDEQTMLDAIDKASLEIKKLIDIQEQLAAQVGVPKRAFEPQKPDDELRTKVFDFIKEDMKKAMSMTDRAERKKALKALKERVENEFEDVMEEKCWDIRKALNDAEKKEMRRIITEENKRVDGRDPDEIRHISCEVTLLPRAHGSGLFTRGQTQVLSALTLGAMGEVQKIDGLGVEEFKRFIHHYNFPPFSTGETGFMRGPKRREIGHGALVESALFPVIPGDEAFPYAIRLVSEVLESNGSSSMASVCAGSLALMDAGVPIKRPVAGVAMGLIQEGDKETVLTDIMGIEDFMGDMDFKIAGTRNGITAWQMDAKIGGISLDSISKALEKAKTARLFMLDKMEEVLPETRSELSKYAPRVITITIPTDKIREVIGPGGKMIRSIIEETGAAIDIEDTGQVFITGKDVATADKAKDIIERLTAPPKPVAAGEQYMGTVVSIAPFGAFVEIVPGRDGLVHISKLAPHRVEKVEDVVKIGQKLLVDVIGVDNQGRVSLAVAGAKSSKPGDNGRK
jgi:polyribonucleotide nucleotidyltransferase